MLEKATTLLFNIRRLANSICFWGYLGLGLAAITGMAWAYCRPELEKQKHRASGEATDTHATGKGEDK